MSAYTVRFRGGAEHYDDVLLAMPAARACVRRGEKNVRVFRCDPSGEVLLSALTVPRDVRWVPLDTAMPQDPRDPVDNVVFADRATRGLL